MEYRKIRIDYMDREANVVTSIYIESDNCDSAFNRLYEVRKMLDNEKKSYIVFTKKRGIFSRWNRLYTINDLK